MWTSYDFIDKACRGTFGENRLDMFMKNLDLKIVDFTDIPDWDNYELTIKDARIEQVCDRKILSIFYTDKFDRSHQYIAEVCD